MDIERVAIDSVRVDTGNVRKHGQKNLETIKRSLEAFGQQKPIVVTADGLVVAGNGTLDAARALGWNHIDVVRTALKGSARKAYAVADNRTAELAEWDDTGLAEYLAGLQADTAFDETLTGFDAAEISRLIGSPEIVEDEAPPVPEAPVTRSGDLWLLDEHRVLCGDATKAEDVGRCMGGKKADLCFTSPPYAQQREYEKKIEDWDGLMEGVFSNLPMAGDGQVLVNLGLIHRDNEWQPYWEWWIEWMRKQGWRRFGWYVWDKLCGHPGDWDGRLRPSHEFIFHFNRQSVKPIKIVECINAGRRVHGRSRKPDGVLKVHTHDGRPVQDVRIEDSVIRCGAAKGQQTSHPAPFPVSLAEPMIKSWLGNVCDPFLGSGTTLIAAEQLGRRCYGIEICENYVDVTLKRWMNLTGKSPVRESDGVSFSDLAIDNS